MKILLDPIFPGEILMEEYMIPLNLSQNQLARDIDVPVGRINQIIHNRRVITADTALRLARYFGTSPELWLGLQNDYDLRCAKKKSGNTISKRIHTYQESHAHPS